MKRSLVEMPRVASVLWLMAVVFCGCGPLAQEPVSMMQPTTEVVADDESCRVLCGTLDRCQLLTEKSSDCAQACASDRTRLVPGFVRAVASCLKRELSDCVSIEALMRKQRFDLCVAA